MILLLVTARNRGLATEGRWPPAAARSQTEGLSRADAAQDIEATRRFYRRICQVYDVIADAGERSARELGLELLDARTDERILEIGFGTGTTIVSIACAVGSRGRVVGVDMSEGMCQAPPNA